MVQVSELTDGQLIDRIGQNDQLVSALDFCPVELLATLAAEYRRRFGVDLPPDRPLTWCFFHSPDGWHWQCTALSSGASLQRLVIAVAEGATKLEAEAIAERLLVRTYRTLIGPIERRCVLVSDKERARPPLSP
jgi:hypothetical protein